MHLHTFWPKVAIISTAGPQQVCIGISLWDVSTGFWVSALFWGILDSQSVPWLPTPSQLQRFRAARWWSESRRYECHLAHQSSEHQHPATKAGTRALSESVLHRLTYGWMREWLYQIISHIKHLDDCLCKAYDVHSHRHSVGEGKDEPDGASKLRPQAPGDQVVCSSWRAVTRDINLCIIICYW